MYVNRKIARRLRFINTKCAEYATETCSAKCKIRDLTYRAKYEIAHLIFLLSVISTAFPNIAYFEIIYFDLSTPSSAHVAILFSVCLFSFFVFPW